MFLLLVRIKRSYLLLIVFLLMITLWRESHTHLFMYFIWMRKNRVCITSICAIICKNSCYKGENVWLIFNKRSILKILRGNSKIIQFMSTAKFQVPHTHTFIKFVNVFFKLQIVCI